MPTHDPETPPDAKTPERVRTDPPHLSDETVPPEDTSTDVTEGLRGPVDPPAEDEEDESA